MSRRKDRVPNAALGHDVSRPEQHRRKAVQPTSASMLAEEHIYTLAWHEARSPIGHPADRCYSLYGFHASDDDRAHVEWVISLHPEWQPWLDLARLGWEQWYAERCGPEGPCASCGRPVQTRDHSFRKRVLCRNCETPDQRSDSPAFASDALLVLSL